MEEFKATKIIHISPSYKPAYCYGGPTMSVAQLCQELSQSGLNVAVLTTKANGSKELKVESNRPFLVDGVSVQYFPRLTKDHTHFSPALLFGLYKIIKQSKSCKLNLVIHVHSWWNLVALCSTLISVYHRIPIVVSPRGMITSYTLSFKHTFVKRLLHWMIGRYLLQNVTIHATSLQEARNIEGYISIKKLFVVPNLVNLPDLDNLFSQLTVTSQHCLGNCEALKTHHATPSYISASTLINNNQHQLMKSTFLSSADRNQKLNENKMNGVAPVSLCDEMLLENDRPNLLKMLFLSRIDPKKGLEPLFEALSVFTGNWNLSIAGTGERHYLKELGQLSSSLNINNKIKWLGHLENQDKYKVLQKHDLLVLTSKNENFANVLIESLAVGTPVLVSDKVGLAPYIIETGFGWVSTIEPLDILRQLELLYKDSTKRNFIRAQSPDQIDKDFNNDKILKDYLAMYESTMMRP